MSEQLTRDDAYATDDEELATYAADDEFAAGQDEAYGYGERSDRRGEWIKFGVLAVILLGTIVVIALLRPLIFGRVVPAVLGEGLNPPTLAPEVEPAGESEAAVDDEEEAQPPAEEMEEDEPVAAEEGAPAGEETGTEAAPAGDQAAVPGGDGVRVHIVKTGDSLVDIAAEYGVTVEQILAANPQITNRHRIIVGDEIIIPRP